MTRKTALVVNADPKVAEMLSDVLKDWTIQHAGDNRAVLALAERKQFDLILTGESTSGEEDLELLRKIRRLHPHTRLIILTDKSTPADVIASMRESVFSYFSKPFSLAALAEMVRIATEGPCWDDGIEIVSATPSWLCLLVRCDSNSADRLLQFLHEVGELPEPERTNVAMAFREILLNAIEHGGNFNPEQYVEISYLRARHMVMCRVKDPGEGFTLDEIRHAAFANPPGEPLRHLAYRDVQGLRPGGFGVMIARHLVDELIYGEHGNDVLLVKYLDQNRYRTA